MWACFQISTKWFLTDCMSFHSFQAQMEITFIQNNNTTGPRNGRLLLMRLQPVEKERSFSLLIIQRNTWQSQVADLIVLPREMMTVCGSSNNKWKRDEKLIKLLRKLIRESFSENDYITGCVKQDLKIR